MASDIYVTLQSALAVPFPGVVIRLYQDDGGFGVYLAEDTTDAMGQVAFVSYPDDDYLIRVRVPSGNPLVVPAGLTQSAEISGSDISVTITAETVALPISSDPLYCRCSGYFTDITGAPKTGVSLYFSRTAGIPVGIISTGRTLGIFDHAYRLVLDQDGYGEIDLPQDAELYVTTPDEPDIARQIFVPASRSANLADVVYPYPYRVTYQDAGVPVTSITIAAGASKILDIAGLLRSGIAADPLSMFVQYAAVAGLTLVLTDTTFTVTGVTPGTYSVVPLPATSGFLLPEPTILGTLGVEVT